MTYRSKQKPLLAMYDKMLALAADLSSELYHKGMQRSGARHRVAFWDGYNGVTKSTHVIPGTISEACAAAGRDFRKARWKEGKPVVEFGPGYLRGFLGRNGTQPPGASPVPRASTAAGSTHARRPGRPPESPETVRSLRFGMRLTKAERETIDAMGGGQWLAGQVRRLLRDFVPTNR